MWIALYAFAGIVGLVVLFVVVLAIIASQRPVDFRLTRQAAMAAPPAAAFEQVNDFHNWDNWSPWAKLDPNMTVTHAGPSAGVGASYAWTGNGKVGQGRMEIKESRPGELVRIELQFLKPFKATNEAEFTFRPEGGKTLVTWAMTGKMNLPMRMFGVLMNMDKAVGKDFEKGLAALKATVEGDRAG
ncbi:MAG TPA: SRPBCC family protein [Gemmataceae bacterium]|nr:SRPBCC family protein [Gemmataceae bacterium]